MHEYVAYLARAGPGYDPSDWHITVHDLEDPDRVGPEGTVESAEKRVLGHWFRDRGFTITGEFLDGRAFRLRRT
ncbi:hypothetical protein GCM10009847_04610 [Leucobacter tardus]|uniref:Uncharacterized protein n=1 Tax=Leucobacter tardus TaxID=501483 RepID=A0A939QCL7_9MICO|nr:hypothetical protein [Leucobacter tardus]MBO2988668.1 hypothetical protein [Leucobacter tardus]